MYTISLSLVDRYPTLYDALSDPVRQQALAAVMFNGEAALTEMRLRDGPYYQYVDGAVGVPTSDLYYPVRAGDSSSSKVIGAVGIEFLWEKFIVSTAPANANLLLLVIENTCGQSHSYKFDTANNRLILESLLDVHDSKYGDLVKGTDYEGYDTLRSLTGDYPDFDVEHCSYQFKLYPTQEMEAKYTGSPVVFAVGAGTIFVFASLAFIAYDVLIRRRQSKVMTSAKRTNDIVTSLFPENVRHRLYDRVSSADTAADTLHRGVTTRLPGLLNCSTIESSVFGSEPIADLFPHTTVMFLDIANFTAWSSEREPSQVFTLLENLYHCFDEIGRRLGIFKVETIGDSYVAAAGLPKARNDHAVGGSRRAIFFAFLFAPLLTIHRLIFVSNDSVCA
jgi:Adenylate and Guanylate cyclase catalytic domain